MESNRYLEKITIVKTHRSLKKSLEIELVAGINLIVGDQGCGKSTLLEGLQKHSNWLKVDISEYTKNNGVKTYYFDTEKGNPRIKNSGNLDNSDQWKSALVSHFKSHGETLVELTVNCLKKTKNSIIFLDEPESGLSIKNQFRLMDSLNIAAENNCQLIVATHNMYLIQNSSNLYSLEHNKWMNGNEYIEKIIETDRVLDTTI